MPWSKIRMVASITIVIALLALIAVWVNTFGDGCNKYQYGWCVDFTKRHEFNEKLAVRTNYNGAV